MLNQSAGLDRTFTALADPTRRALIARLSQGPASISDLARPFAMSLPAVMQHVTVLEDAGIVRTEKIGRVRTCQIVPRALGEVEQWLDDRRREWSQRLDRLGDYLKTLDEEGNDNDREKP
jgi:DNA-binding transcriptional ArsR family regulator